MKYANLGTISHGTLRNEDLLSSFAYELNRLVSRNLDNLGSLEVFMHGKLIGEAEVTAASCAESDLADLILEKLTCALEEFAAPYCYFGSHEGDGSDFGFWPSWDSIDELTKYNDLSEVPAGVFEDYCVVNDHGNVSVYGADGTLIWDCV